MQTIGEQQAEAAVAAKGHQRLGFQLNTPVKHAGQVFHLGENKISGIQVDPVIGGIGYFAATTPIRNFYRLIPIERDVLILLQPLCERELQGRLVLNIPAAFLGMEQATAVAAAMRHLTAGLEQVEVVDVETHLALKPKRPLQYPIILRHYTQANAKGIQIIAEAKFYYK